MGGKSSKPSAVLEATPAQATPEKPAAAETSPVKIVVEEGKDDTIMTKGTNLPPSIGAVSEIIPAEDEERLDESKPAPPATDAHSPETVAEADQTVTPPVLDDSNLNLSMRDISVMGSPPAAQAEVVEDNSASLAEDSSSRISRPEEPKLDVIQSPLTTKQEENFSKEIEPNEPRSPRSPRSARHDYPDETEQALEYSGEQTGGIKAMQESLQNSKESIAPNSDAPRPETGASVRSGDSAGLDTELEALHSELNSQEAEERRRPFPDSSVLDEEEDLSLSADVSGRPIPGFDNARFRRANNPQGEVGVWLEDLNDEPTVEPYVAAPKPSILASTAVSSGSGGSNRRKKRFDRTDEDLMDAIVQSAYEEGDGPPGQNGCSTPPSLSI
ncbi:hypothetical protein CYMTET_7681 [Cymbomonas tetramitiformis]|uniref:Uncharacterized protein n=1 Tax=Cymbomonas tetramitiformis TaxID=36881 RepID=A0AAE0GV14_9CHLO|nr:hypothetical protein CYMTET_7681 [Cymbomonas tetramitiformis]